MLKRQLMSSAFNRGNYYTYNIMLGSACNWKCPYCIQTPQVAKQADPNFFCDRLIDHLQKTQRLDKINTFCFWGGEPLLYYKSIEIILNRLIDIVPIRDWIRISSNGSLLTEQNYNLFNQYPIKFEISYHEGQLTDDKWKITLKINRLIVSSLITHKVLDWKFYFEKWQRICDRYGRVIKWFIFPLIYAGNAGSDYALTKQDIDQYIDSLRYHLDNDLDNVFYKTAFEGLIYDCSSKGLNQYTNYCYNEKSIAIDLNGNRYSCHHDYSKEVVVGNIFNSIPIYWQPLVKQYCSECKAYPICVGGCFRNKDQTTWCYYYQKIWDLLQLIKTEYKQCFSERYIKLI